MRILYITAQTPYGRGETFILEEMLEIKRRGIDLLIIPRNPSKEIFHKEAKELKDNVIYLPLINLKMVLYFLYCLICKPLVWRIIKNIIISSRSLKILFKNLIVLPKSIYISKIIGQIRVNHIHAHWGSTTATIAYIVSQLTGIPWSFTLHRWDIYENNILKEKARTTSFVRCISERGKNDLLKIIGEEFRDRVEIIYMGVRISNLNSKKLMERRNRHDTFIIATPANLLPVKGHRYLIEACSILIERGITNFKCIFYGDGPLKEDLKRLIERRNLVKYVELYGFISHERLLDLYRRKKIDTVVLPSIITENGEHEGIPVALMEAMAFGIPVISTYTGSIPELAEGVGILVPEKDPLSLANAIEKYILNKDYMTKLGLKGRERILKDFNIKKNVTKLIEKIKENSKLYDYV